MAVTWYREGKIGCQAQDYHLTVCVLDRIDHLWASVSLGNSYLFRKVVVKIRKEHIKPQPLLITHSNEFDFKNDLIIIVVM